MKKNRLAGRPTKPYKTTYSLPTLLFTGILMFLFKLGSRRQIDFLFNSPEFITHIELLSGQKLERSPDNDTIDYICELLAPAQLQKTRLHIIQSLIRSRALEYNVYPEGNMRSSSSAILSKQRLKTLFLTALLKCLFLQLKNY